MSNLTIINQQDVMGKNFSIYGTFENPLFLAKDVAQWIQHTNTAKMLNSVDEDEKLIEQIVISGQKRDSWFLTEDGLYEILMLSRKPRAKQFKKEVKALIKSLRLNKLQVTTPPSQLELARQVVTLLEERETLSIKAQVADEIANSEGLYLPSTVGKIVTGHPNNFCQWLVDNGIMFRKGDKLLPMAKYTDKYFEVKVSTFKSKSKEQSYFTPRGLAWIEAKYLKANGMLQLGYKEVTDG